MPSRAAGRLRAFAAIPLLAVLALAAAVALARTPAAEPFTQGLLFRIEARGKAPSWVYGTLHSNDPRVARLPPPVAHALSASRMLAPETLLSPDDPFDFMAAAQFDDARRLSDYLDVDERARLRVALGAGSVTEEALDRLKPWAAWVMLDRQGQASGAPILDELLVVEARARRMTIIGIELLAEQVAAMDTLPVSSQVAMLRWSLANAHRRDADLEALIQAWLARDLARIESLRLGPARIDPSLAPHLQQVAKHLVANRNIQMAHRLFLPLRDGGVFVAVGALHLHGRQGLLALIQEQGYRITRVY